MNGFIHRRSALRAGLALGVSLIVPTARACEYFSTTLRITHPWTRATGHAAFAVVCMRFDEVAEADRLIGVETPVASGAQLVGGGSGGDGVNLLIPEGRETLLSEDGTHIRLVGLKHPLMIARSYPLTLVFEKGGSVSALLNVDYLSPLPPGRHHT